MTHFRVFSNPEASITADSVQGTSAKDNFFPLQNLACSACKRCGTEFQCGKAAQRANSAREATGAA